MWNPTRLCPAALSWQLRSLHCLLHPLPACCSPAYGRLELQVCLGGLQHQPGRQAAACGIKRRRQPLAQRWEAGDGGAAPPALCASDGGAGTDFAGPKTCQQVGAEAIPALLKCKTCCTPGVSSRSLDSGSSAPGAAGEWLWCSAWWPSPLQLLPILRSDRADV